VTIELQTAHYLQKYINLIQAMTEITDIINKCPNNCNKISKEILLKYDIATNSHQNGRHESQAHAGVDVINVSKIMADI
jgi:hypothetical protein